MDRSSILIDCPHTILEAALRKFIDQTGRLVALPPSAGNRADLILYVRLSGGDVDHLERLCRRHPAVPVLVLLGSDDRAERARCLRTGAVGFVTPDEPAEGFEGRCLRAIEMARERPAPLKAPHTAPTRHLSSGYRDLTYRELTVLDLVKQGYTNREVALALAVSEHTVRAHMRGIMQKLNVTNRVQAATQAMGPVLLRGVPS